MQCPWIPLTEEKPAHREIVDIKGPNFTDTAAFFKSSEGYFFSKDLQRLPCNRENIHGVTHWRPK